MKALIIIADRFEDSRLLVPLYWLREEGVKADVVSIKKGILRGTRGYEVEVKKTIDEIRPDDYSALILPGGATKAMPERALAIARYFMEKNKVVAAACQGLQALISAGLLKGRRAACHKSIAAEVIGSGAFYEDREVVIDGKLVTCCRPADLPAFSAALIELIENEKWFYTMEDVL